jgi:hypothetical protein
VNKDEALKMAIETNNWLKSELWVDMLAGEELDKVTNACKEALEQPAWQGLTDDEIIDMYFQANISPQPAEDVINFIRAIEQALKEKNI